MQPKSVTARVMGCVAYASAVAAAVGCSSSSGGPSGTPPFSIGSIQPAAHDTSFASPFDATPDATGQNVYFTAIGANGPGVFKVAASGGAITTLTAGDPLVSPFSIAISSDGSTLYVADIGAETPSGDAGAIFSIPAGGGAPTLVAGTDGMLPRGLEVAADTVYFTGTGKDGRPGVFKMASAGGAPSTVLAGDPLHEPSGVTVDKAGNVYVVDAASPTSSTARVVQINAAGAASVFVDGIAVGYPAGIVLDQAESTLLVSAIDPDKGTDTVLVVDVASRKLSQLSQGIDSFVEPAGLHRAKGADVFAWADSAANNTGTVYVLKH